MSNPGTLPDKDWLTSDFDFDLPESLIAQHAVEPRDAARLLHVAGTALSDHHVFDLPELLRPDDLLVMNDTKVIPARLYGRRGDVPVEILLHKSCGASEWLAFARPGKRLRIGDTITFAENFTADVVDKNEDGQVRIKFAAGDAELMRLLHQYGEPPLPPYIHRDKGAARQDESRYQTVYARREGAVAAPTAGLHFTEGLLAKLEAKGIESLRVTLHVGAGTFLPVKAERLSEHKMHAEWGELDADTADKINAAKKRGRRVVSVGTTSLRLLESATDADGTVKPFCGDTSIFIYPGYRFRCVDALMTNFHLPKSTLFMLVCAFAGMDHMRAAYAHAMQRGYRFYSYGDASLLERI